MRTAGKGGSAAVLALGFALLAALLLAPTAGFAQAPAAPAGPPGAVIEAAKARLDAVEATLRRPNLRSEDLQRLRSEIDPPADALRAVIEEATPRAEALRQRVRELGDKAPNEGADVARDRTEREGAAGEAEDLLRVARATLLQAEQLTAQVVDRRRALLTRTLFERASSLLDPRLWMEAARLLPREVNAVLTLGSDVAGGASERLAGARSVPLLVAIALAFALALPVRRFTTAFVRRRFGVASASRLRRAALAAALAVAGAAAVAAAVHLVVVVLDAGDYLPGRAEPLAVAVLQNIGLVFTAWFLADAILAPGRPGDRLFETSETTARRFVRAAAVGVSFVAADRVLDVLAQIVVAGATVVVVAKGLLALGFALQVGRALMRSGTEDCDEQGLGPYVPTGPNYAGAARAAVLLALGAVVAAVALGYVAFASYLAGQIVAAGVIAGALVISLALVDEGVAWALDDRRGVTRRLRSALGLRERTLEQIGVVAAGLLRVVLIFTAALLVLAPWGVESTDVLGSLRAAFFGFRIGDVTISISAVVLATAFFLIGVTITRAVRRWLDTALLPRTDLDAGVRNSIGTGVGYAGMIVAAALAVSQLGVSFDKLTIVAGALSVGIGFGLQSIVQNFVSGLIILLERAIKVGDWIVVGDQQGHVRRINVRSTEIATFDRGTVIVPNANLVSGVVKNWVLADRSGRVQVSYLAPRDADPDKVADVLRETAAAHRDVLREPQPRVFLKKINENSLDFELTAFVADVEQTARVGSELNFDVLRRLRAAGIGTPAAPAPLDIEGLDDISESLARLADANDPARREREPAPPGPRPLPRVARAEGAS